MTPSAVDVVDVVPAFVELADRVEPPVDVATAVRARQPDVFTDGNRHRVPGSSELVGDLYAGCRCADDEHLTVVRDLGWVAVLERSELPDVLRQRRGNG